MKKGSRTKRLKLRFLRQNDLLIFQACTFDDPKLSDVVQMILFAEIFDDAETLEQKKLLAKLIVSSKFSTIARKADVLGLSGPYL